MSTTTATESTLLDAQITLIETPNPNPPKTVDDVWREIVSGERKTCKQEQDDDDDEIMTLEDFLVKAGAVEEVQVDDMKMKEERLSLSGVRAKRHRSSSITNVLEPLDKAAQQRQRRMIKNRESAARSRERKQVSNFF
jgi:ABA responsive element binding factor